MTSPKNIIPIVGSESKSVRGPKIDEPAPLFTAQTTQGPLSLKDFQGQWVLLFSHPADFTPVCTSEFIAFQNALPDFKDLNCALLGLSVDSILSHIAWLESIETKFGIKITFPVIEDFSKTISTLYGMIHEKSSSTETVRCVFLINPEGILKAITYYPLTVGRSISELLRLLKALQLSERENVAIPAEWQPGEDVLVNTPLLNDETDDSTNGQAWYYQKADKPKSRV